MFKKSISKFAIAVLAAASNLTQAQTLGELFDSSKVHELLVTMLPADWQTLKKNYTQDTYYKCDLQWQGIVRKNCGIRSRGSGSRNPIKPGLGISFSKYTSSQRLAGLKSIVLRNFTQDPSFVHESVTMKMFEKLGLPFEREAHAKVYVNGEYVGLYLMVEPIDEHFTDSRFGETDGYLYEFNWTGTHFYFDDLGSDPSTYAPDMIEPKNHDADPQINVILDMIRAANASSDAEFPSAIGKYMDLGAFVTHMAAEQFLAETDGVLNPDGMRNFYWYRRLSDNRFNWLVWDKEWTFSTADFSIWSGTDRNVLMRRALGIPAIRQRYLDTLLAAATIAGGPGGWLETETNRQLNMVHDAAVTDPQRVCYLEGQDLVPCPLETVETNMRLTGEFPARRTAFVLEELRAAGVNTAQRMLLPTEVRVAESTVSRLVPGSLAEIDTELSVSKLLNAANYPVPAALGGVSVQVGGVDAPVLSVSPSGVIVQVPWEIPCGPASVVVSDSGHVTNTVAAAVVPSSPVILSVAGAAGEAMDASHPVRSGDTIVVWVTGLGYANAKPTTGMPPEMNGAAVPKGAIAALIAGSPAVIQATSPAPGYLGLQQVTIKVPDQLPSGTNVPLKIITYDESSAPFALPVR